METLTRATAFSLFLILLGIGVLVLVITELTSSPAPTTESVLNDSNQMNQNWFSPRTFKLLTGESTLARGIDAELLAEQNLFIRPANAATPTVAPKVEKLPEKKPPPPTKQVTVVYQGLYQTSGGKALAYLEVDGITYVVPMQGKVASGWTLVEANRNEIWLINAEDTREKLLFNKKKRLEVPIQ
jgi:hypothetical protein